MRVDRLRHFAAAAGLMATLLAATVRAAPGNYDRPGQFPVRPALIPLPPGAVEPAGWLRDWARAAADGITGQLDRRSRTFGDAWQGASLGDWPDDDGTLEQCSYWLDGLTRLGYLLRDDPLMRKAAGRLNFVVDGVHRGGKSFVYWKGDMPRGFNSWAHSQMGRALVGFYEASGDQRVLDALVKAYCQYPAPMGSLDFAAQRTNSCPISGLCNLDAILEAYSFSGDRRLLERARAAIAAPDVQATVRRWLDGQFGPGHTVCAYELIRLPALFYLATGEAKYLQASRNAFRWIEENHLLPYGVASGQEWLCGVGAFRLTETCNVTASIWSMHWLYRITGQRAWGDRIERVFFNAAPAPVARDFQTMCYYQSPNRIRAESLPGEQLQSTGKGCLRFTGLGYPRTLCCAGAVNRVLPSYIQHMWMATADGGLAATLYGPCTVSALCGAKVPVKLTCRTAYPFEERVRVTVAPDRPASFPLSFRLPGWCEKPRVSVNGSPWEAAPDQSGFASVGRQWVKGDVVTLEFPMAVRVQRGFETEYPESFRKFTTLKSGPVFHDRRLPYESVFYGPLLFALPIADADPNTPLPGARWQYALDNAAGLAGGDIEVERRPMPARWDWPLDAPLVLRAPARPFDWTPTEEQALPDAAVAGDKGESIRLVPYGCTKFRISMFPVTPKAWGKM